MPYYHVWEKKTVFLTPAQLPGTPPLHPSHPIMLPGMPGWEPGTPSPPEGPPVIWPGPHPSHPIMLPGMPGWAQPTPPDVKPPVEPPEEAILPDLASPGFWVQVVFDTYTRPGWIQTALITNPEHEKKPPEKGTPGEWIPVYSTSVGYTYAWLPAMNVEEPATRKKK